jgi:hypothetical protein
MNTDGVKSQAFAMNTDGVKSQTSFSSLWCRNNYASDLVGMFPTSHL